ncbi:MAG: 16S rRNA (cytosine(1402)-N(4))-methyltransferase RsmH, partial [Geminicoccaceae bacterium]|nr:16S rRNA (cytosine(1402)-N(4))-methyltransferase RsmH [Geminicoccaceae bacterium]
MAHEPVLLDEMLTALAPAAGEVYVDGTFGGGGYARALLKAAPCAVVALDRDPAAIARGRAAAPPGLTLIEGRFGELDAHAAAAGHAAVDGVVLDLGVSSFQIDEPGRGFSFQKDGPLDMRMGTTGPTAADLVNTATEAALADILFHYGEERAARRIARAIVAARPLARTLELAQVIERCLPRQKPGQSHPATRSFQAIRIAVNDEFGQLVLGLEAAERALAPGGRLAVVSFHSLEDR